LLHNIVLVSRLGLTLLVLDLFNFGEHGRVAKLAKLVNQLLSRRLNGHS
jgi:hypothetical protein